MHMLADQGKNRYINIIVFLSAYWQHYKPIFSKKIFLAEQYYFFRYRRTPDELALLLGRLSSI